MRRLFAKRKQITLYFDEQDYAELVAKAGREPLATYIRRILFDGAEPRRAGDEWPRGQRAGTPLVTEVQPSGSAEMPTAPMPFERKSAKPLFKRPGRLL